jgi:phosphohistidine phosphatase
MHQLILLRHAKAARASSGISDHDRPLTLEGRKAATAMGETMRNIGLAPDVVLVSSALRTQETLDALEPWEDRPNIETLPNLYMATQPQIRDFLRALPETVRSVLVIGHNPGLHELAQSLAGQSLSGPAAAKPELARLAENYPTASLAEFLVATPWHKLGAPGATFTRFIRPSDLPLASPFSSR